MFENEEFSNLASLEVKTNKWDSDHVDSTYEFKNSRSDSYEFTSVEKSLKLLPASILKEV